MEFLKRTWAEIDLDKLLDNWNQIKNLSNGRYTMPVIKADAYGHGANVLSKIYEKNGADYFAVSNLDEAVKLRKCGVNLGILILGFTPIECANELYKFNITQAVFSKEYADALSKSAINKNITLKVHIKLDTGMSRIGFNCRDDSYGELIKCLSLSNLEFEGVFTHFSSADSVESADVEFTEKQYNLFNDTVSRLKTDGYNFKYIHCCNSAASSWRENDGNLIRPGIILYGLSPAKEFDVGFNLKPVMSIKTCVSMVKELSANEAVSYGRTFISKNKMRVATLPIGYADGYPRLLSNRGKVIINGKFAPIIGRICMDQMVVDVTGIDSVELGTIVTVVGTDGESTITLNDIADACNTISYEVACDMSVRMPRVYIKNNNVIDVVYLGGLI